MIEQTIHNCFTCVFAFGSYN